MVQLVSGTRLFINIHKWCGAENVSSPIEALRLSPMLTAGAPVISESVYSADRMLYDGLVSFVPSWPQFAGAVQQQLGTRDESWCAEADARAHEFRRRFAPITVLRRAGIYSRVGQLLHGGYRP